MSDDAWRVDCLKWRGSVLDGRGAHWCIEWDDLPVDETCSEWGSKPAECCCGFPLPSPPPIVTDDDRTEATRLFGEPLAGPALGAER